MVKLFYERHHIIGKCVKTRKRYPVVMKQANGKDCEGKPEETQSCSKDQCIGKLLVLVKTFLWIYSKLSKVHFKEIHIHYIHLSRIYIRSIIRIQNIHIWGHNVMN